MFFIIDPAKPYPINPGDYIIFKDKKQVRL